MTLQADPSQLFIFPEIPLVSPGPARDSSLGGGVIHIYMLLFAVTVIEEGFCRTRGVQRVQGPHERRKNETGWRGKHFNEAKGLESSKGSKECVHVQ